MATRFPHDRKKMEGRSAWNEAVEAISAVLCAIESTPPLRAPYRRTKFDVARLDLVGIALSDEFGDFNSDPVPTLLRRGLNKIGKRLAIEFDLEDLAAIAEYAARFSGGDYTQRHQIIDGCWDGIVARCHGVYCAD